MILPSIKFDKLTELQKAYRHFPTEIESKRPEEYLVIIWL